MQYLHYSNVQLIVVHIVVDKMEKSVFFDEEKGQFVGVQGQDHDLALVEGPHKKHQHGNQDQYGQSAQHSTVNNIFEEMCQLLW